MCKPIICNEKFPSKWLVIYDKFDFHHKLQWLFATKLDFHHNKKVICNELVVAINSSQMVVQLQQINLSTKFEKKLK